MAMFMVKPWYKKSGELRIVPWSSGTDSEIVAMLEAYYNDQLTWEEMGWSVGDTRIIHLNEMQAPSPNSSSTWAAQDITVTIVAHDHNDLATPVNGHTKACITVQTRETISSVADTAGAIYVNGNSAKATSFTKWSSLYMRTYLNSVVLGAIPSGAFKSAIKPISHYMHTTYNDSSTEQVVDTLFLPSYPEIFGSASWSPYIVATPAEGTQFEYYQTASNRIKYDNNNGSQGTTAGNWWMSSPSSSYSSTVGYRWCYVKGNGVANSDGGTVSCRLSPSFAL